MASFDVAYEWMMDNEDSRREYAIVPDVGGQAISGINSHSFPAQFAAIAALPQAERGPAVRNFYMLEFWNHWFDALVSDDISKRVFDASVNMGGGTAVRLLQQAVGVFVDGAWGPETVAATNASSPVAAFIAARCQHYRDIVTAKPSDEKYLEEWLARASK